MRWHPPEDPNGGIIKYVIEYQPVGHGSPHPWVDTDDGNKTTKDVTALNGSTLYQFRVRAFSKVPGEWSKFVQAMTQEDGEEEFKMSSLVSITDSLSLPELIPFSDWETLACVLKAQTERSFVVII